MSLISKLEAVKQLGHLSNDDLEVLAKGAVVESYRFGESVISLNEPCKGVAVLVEGIVRLFTDVDGKHTSYGLRKTPAILDESAVVSRSRHQLEVRASSDVKIARIPFTDFDHIIKRNPRIMDDIAQVVAFQSVGDFLFSAISSQDRGDNNALSKIINQVGVKQFAEGKTIIQLGDKDEHRLYFVKSGAVHLKDTAGNILDTLVDGDYFGEKAALLNEPHPVSVEAASDTICLVLPQTALEHLLELNPSLKNEILSRIFTTEQRLQSADDSTNTIKKPFNTIFNPRFRVAWKAKKFPFVQQAEEMDCSAACLTMVCRYYDANITIGKIRELVNVGQDGASLRDVATAAESMGFATRGVRCDFSTLCASNLPAIVHWEGYHFVVVISATPSHVWIADPAKGVLELTRKQFERGWAGVTLFIDNHDVVATEKSISPWKRFVAYLKPHYRLLGLTLLATLIIQLLTLAPPLITQNVLDQVVVHNNEQLLIVLMIGFVIINVFSNLITLLRNLLTNYVVRHIDYSMAVTFYQHVLSQPVSFFIKRRTGDLFARFQENQKVRDFLTEATISTILSVFMIFVYVIALCFYNVQLTFVLLGLALPLLLLAFAITPKVKKYARETFDASTEAESKLMESISAAETVKAMGLEQSMRNVWEEKYAKSLNVRYKASRFDALVNFVSQLINVIATTAVLWYGATLVLDQQLSVGQLIAFNMIMGSVMSPLLSLVKIWDELQETTVAMERLGDVLDLEPEQSRKNIANQLIIPELKGGINVKDVYFRYNDNDPDIVSKANFEVRPGQVLAIVGPSGSGKTTLAKLLLGFFTPTRGQVFIDDLDLQKLHKSNLRRSFGYVMQNNVVFSGTVAENIAIGDEEPDYSKIEKAARLADAHEFITTLPHSYEQRVGERGMGLSGGQIQRICIARALYREPKLLVFDEATSSLDAQSESNIIHNMKKILKNRTAIVIAHRLSTVMHADLILVLNSGRIVEQGRHEELIAQQGIYFELVNKQMAT